jgi:hypothetical protein
MKQIKRTNTMNYYSTLFQRYNVDDNLLNTRAKKRAIGSVLETVDKKAINTTQKLDKSKVKKLNKAFGKTSWFKNIAAGLTFATAVSLFQAPPLEANIEVSSISKIKQNFVSVSIDEDSSSQALDKNANKTDEIKTTSLHLISNKAQSNTYPAQEKNSVLLDDDSDVSFMPVVESKSLTVIDTTIEDWETLAKSVSQGAVLLLQKDDNALDMMIKELQKIGSVDALNIISHGASGELHFSNQTISLESLEKNTEKWKELGSYLDKDGDILLYGCNVALDDKGNEFIKTLASLTDADIAASINPTGNSHKGGDWELENVVGTIDKNIHFSSSLFDHVLAPYDLNTTTEGELSKDSDGYVSHGLFYNTKRMFKAKASSGSSIYSTTVVSNRGIYIYNDSDYEDNLTILPNREVIGNFDLNDVNMTRTGVTIGGKIASLTFKGTKLNNSTVETTINNISERGVTATSKGADFSSFTNIKKIEFIMKTENQTFDFFNFHTLDLTNIVPATAPTANNFTFGNNIYNQATTFNWKELSNASDINGDDLNISAQTNGTKGNITVNGDNVTYTPSQNKSGSDDFNLTINDNTDSVNGTTKTIAVTVYGINTNSTTTTSGIVYTTQPRVYAVDEYGNIDADYVSNITLSEDGNGSLDGTISMNAVAGKAIFTDIKYNASADNETYKLIAKDNNLTDANSNTITSEVVATKLIFTTSPAPTTIGQNITKDFTTDPIVKAVDENNITDVDFTELVTLSENGAGDGVFTNNTATAIAGIATFSGTTLTYDATGTFNITANDVDGTGSNLSIGTSSNITSSDITAPTGYSVNFTTDPINNANKTALAFVFSGAEVGSTYNYSIDDTNGGTTAITGSGTIASATDAISSIDVSSLDDDTLTLSVTLTDTAGNVGNATTDTVTKDIAVPTISSVGITSNNTITSKAKTGDEITVTFTTNETVTLPTATIAGHTATVVNTSGNTYTAKYTMVSGDTEGDIAFTLDGTDSVGNVGTQVTTTGDGHNVTFDKTNPTLSILSPVDNATGQSINSNLVLTLSEDVMKGTGNILIKKATDNSIVETIDVTSGLVSISATTVTINPSVTLDINTEYYIEVPATAFDDTTGNSFAGITDTTSWSFTTANDVTAPTITSVSIPNVPSKIGDIVTVTFTVDSDSDDYTTGSGALNGTIGGYTLGSFTKVNDTTYTATYNITSGGTDVIASDDLPVNLTITDSAGNITGAYTTAISQDNDGLDSNKPTMSSISPTNGGTVLPTAVFTITMNEDMAVGVGTIVIKKASDNTIIETIDATSGMITISGGVITINRSVTLDFNTEYYIQIDDGAFKDSVGNGYVGINDTSSWKFTTTQGILSNLSSLTIEKGSVDNSTKVLYTLSTGNSLKYMYSNSSVTTPTYGDTLPGGALNYTNGADMPDAEVGLYLIIYEVNASSKIVGFKQQLLTEEHIKMPIVLTGDITNTSIPDVLVDVNTSKFVDTNSTQVNLSKYFTNATAYTYMKKDTNTTVDWLGLNTSTGNMSLTSNIVENNATLLDTKHFIKITGSNSDTNLSTYFTLRFKELNASLEKYMDGNITGFTETNSTGTSFEHGHYDEKNFILGDLNITTEVFQDGAAHHEITGRAVAESKLPDSKITISTNGDLNTSATTINDLGNEVKIEVLAKAEGNITAIHKLSINSVETTATSYIANTKTTVRADRIVETNASISGTTISVQAKPNGNSVYTVAIGDTNSTVSVDLPGGQTTISTAGVVKTTYQTANAETKADGTTQVTLNNDSLLTGSFQAGSSVKIYEYGVNEVIEIITPAATSNKIYTIN